MRNLMGKHWQVLVVALLSCGTMAFGDQATATLQPTPGDQKKADVVYRGVYTFALTGSTAATPAACDDFNWEISTGMSSCFAFSVRTPHPIWRVPLAGISGPFNMCPSRSERFVRTYHACQLASINTLKIGWTNSSGTSRGNKSPMELSEGPAR
ncbi:MAG: hypothetical protein ACLQVL_01485 [Terriglobia bacterium]